MCIDKRLDGQECWMRYEVRFEASGHRNVIGTHRTTLEITKESHLTRNGTCIVATDSTLALRGLNEDIRELARRNTTRIVLEMTAGALTERVVGWGSSGLTYKSETCMVARTSQYECDRTLMVNADRAAQDLSRKLVKMLRNPDACLSCKLMYLSEQRRP
ncbi:DUF371 domain-containing protein [Candidatus Thorarchaeota archaeon]|nr:MAG: DUF371 domain-containing protein [Candidatus Thorarchaeota archaeon]